MTIWSNVSPARIADALDWLPGKLDGTGMLMGNGQWLGIPNSIRRCIQPALDEIEQATGKVAAHVMVNVLPAGLVIPVHVDPEPGRHERWHLPLRTNAHAEFWSEAEGHVHMALGSWHGPIEYWMPHSVRNQGAFPRTHLIVDLASHRDD